MMAGRLNKRISIISPRTTGRSTDGAPIIAYSTVLSNAWAAIKPMGGDERFKDDYRWADSDKTFTIRFTTETTITPGMKVVYNSKNYDIKSIINTDEENRSIDLICRRTT